jgi:hypothetical protein
MKLAGMDETMVALVVKVNIDISQGSVVEGIDYMLIQEY